MHLVTTWKRTGYAPLSESMATQLTDAYIRHQSPVNGPLNPSSRYISYNKLLQHWQWPIIYNKTCISKVDKSVCLFGKNGFEKHLMNISNTLRDYIDNGTTWTGRRIWLYADAVFYLQFIYINKNIKRVYLPRALALKVWILYTLIGLLRRGALEDTQNCGLRMRRERFPRHCGLAIPTRITTRASHTWCDACRDR